MSADRQIFCPKSLIFSMGLLEDLQSEIERRALSSGGWASGNARIAGIETTCYGLMALHHDQESARSRAVATLLRTQNPDGTWPAFEGDDREGCWTTTLAVVALRFMNFSPSRLDDSLLWLLNTGGREGQWPWNWKFRTVDRHVQFDPDKYGWPWFSGTVSWVVPTALAILALKQAACCRTESALKRVRLGSEMLVDRACPTGGWNAGNGIVFSAGLSAHLDTTAIALLALTDDKEPVVRRALSWLREASSRCSSGYSLAWSTLAFLLRDRQSAESSLARLCEVLPGDLTTLSTDTLSLAAIAIRAAEGGRNPFKVTQDE
jgi:squalene cyclase